MGNFIERHYSYSTPGIAPIPDDGGRSIVPSQILNRHKLWLENDPLKPPGRQANFSGMDVGAQKLQDLQLDDVRFMMSNLAGTNFTGSSIRNGYFLCTNLKGARFINTNLCSANFEWANLEDAIFDGSDIEGASFRHATLANVDFRRAKLGVIRESALKFFNLMPHDVVVIREALVSGEGRKLFHRCVDYPDMTKVDFDVIGAAVMFFTAIRLPISPANGNATDIVVGWMDEWLEHAN